MAGGHDSITASKHLHYIILFEANPWAFPSIRFLTVTIWFYKGRIIYSNEYFYYCLTTNWQYKKGEAWYQQAPQLLVLEPIIAF